MKSTQWSFFSILGHVALVVRYGWGVGNNPGGAPIGSFRWLLPGFDSLRCLTFTKECCLSGATVFHSYQLLESLMASFPCIRWIPDGTKLYYACAHTRRWQGVVTKDAASPVYWSDGFRLSLPEHAQSVLCLVIYSSYVETNCGFLIGGWIEPPPLFLVLGTN